jgi:hypothetical protein
MMKREKISKECSKKRNTMNLLALKKVLVFVVLLLLLSVLLVSCVLSKMYKIVYYNENQVTNLPDTFRVELPLLIERNHFYVVARINQQYDMKFLIDTKASGLVKEDDLKKYKASYWGEFPKPTHNAYGQKQYHSLYFFDNFEIQSLSFGKPLFKEIQSTNAIYDILDNKGVLGTNILSHLFWKFSMDEKKMILFSNKDTALIKNEVEGYTKIANGVGDKINLIFPSVQKSDNFYLDLGFNGEIEIDKKMFDYLSEKLPYKTLLSVKTKARNEAVYVFDKVDIQLNGILISNCQIIHSPLANLKLIGAEFMRRFNFILAYANRNRGGHGISEAKKDLYIMPVSNFQEIESTPCISDFGFGIGNFLGELIVCDLEAGGLAELAGLELRDKVLRIDNEAFDLNAENRHKRFIAYLADKKQVIVQVERKGQILDFVLTK